MSMVLHTFEMFSALLSTCQVDKSAKNADDGSTSRPAVRMRGQIANVRGSSMLSDERLQERQGDR